MKTTISKILIVLLVLSPVLSIAASPGYLRIVRTHFTGSEVGVGIVDPGTTKFVDGKYITKGLIVNDVDTTSDPRVSGNLIVTVNSIYAGDPLFGTGPLWGTIHISNQDGGWSLIFAGYQSDNCHDDVYAWGQGEGDYEGMRAVWVYQSDSCMFTASESGIITEHR